MPAGLGQLPKLRSLSLHACVGLEALPPMGGLTSLTSLDLSRCEQLVRLPEGLTELAALSTLSTLACSGSRGRASSARRA